MFGSKLEKTLEGESPCGPSVVSDISIATSSGKSLGLSSEQKGKLMPSAPDLAASEAKRGELRRSQRYKQSRKDAYDYILHLFFEDIAEIPILAQWVSLDAVRRQSGLEWYLIDAGRAAFSI